MKLSLLAVGTDAKTVKGEKFGYLTGILYLAPANEAGFGNLCTNASAGCLASCLYTAGRGAMNNVKEARIRKTRLFFSDKPKFLETISQDITNLVNSGKKEQKKVCVRLNGTSDVPWERLGIFDTFPEVQFYDYTKSAKRAIDFALGKMPKNYHLTFSRSEENENSALEVLRTGGNIAAVFANKLPKEWKGYTVIDGDESDLRFNDGKNVVVGLKAKGKGKKDETGFVISA
jgi:hypothetical protein